MQLYSRILITRNMSSQDLKSRSPISPITKSSIVPLLLLFLTVQYFPVSLFHLSRRTARMYGAKTGLQFPLTLTGMREKESVFFLKQPIALLSGISVMLISISIPNALMNLLEPLIVLMIPRYWLLLHGDTRIIHGITTISHRYWAHNKLSASHLLLLRAQPSL